jgi:hypothetical protein
MSVVRAWPAANRRIRNRQAARLLLQFAAAGSLRARGPNAKAAGTVPAFQLGKAGMAVSRSAFTLTGRRGGRCGELTGC